MPLNKETNQQDFSDPPKKNKQLKLMWKTHKEDIKISARNDLLQHTIKVSDHSRGWPEGSLFDSYYTKV